eukprot:1378951-Pyramimonas_sp.AAC.1
MRATSREARGMDVRALAKYRFPPPLSSPPQEGVHAGTLHRRSPGPRGSVAVYKSPLGHQRCCTPPLAPE